MYHDPVRRNSHYHACGKYGGIVLPPDYELYLHYSHMMRNILMDYSDNVEAFGLDENWCDVSPYTHTVQDGGKLADEIRQRMLQELGIFHRCGLLSAYDILSGYDRYFVSDGYAGYNGLGKDAVRCGCWAHLRRKFYDSIPDHNMELPCTARDGVRYCDKLFRIEERLGSVAPDERLRIRQTESRQITDEFYAWLDTLQPANKNLKDAVNYARNQKEALMRFMSDGRIPLSNNAAENAIRPFVVGRKNWLFCKSNDGATAAANAYSIVETAKANGLDVLKYLDFIFKRVPMTDGVFSDEFLETLMPWKDEVQSQCKRGCI